MNIFAKASAGLPLTPAQRAFLRLLEGFFMTGFVVAVQTFALYSSEGYVDWANVAHTALIAGAVAFLLAVAKYYKSHGDVLVSTLASTAAGALESATPTLYTRAEQGAPATSNASGDAATVASVSTVTSTPAAA